jgi:3-deoxy-manno-octulosonate cytidylyltransferase (CMP-KDO synthetase)
MESAVVIPARYNSTRFPGKPLANLLGKPLIQHVYERAKKAKKIKTIIVATDDERIEKAVKSFGGDVIMTSPNHLSGSDRISEVASKLTEDIIINVQGDEPLIEPGLIDELCNVFNNPDVLVATARIPIADLKDVQNPNVVKVVCDRNGFALYFSRSPIPGTRNDISIRTQSKPVFFRHVGIYAYTRNFIMKFSSLEPTPLELQEGLEQLRILEHGYKIKVVDTEYQSIGVDTPDDLEYLRVIMAKEK